MCMGYDNIITILQQLYGSIEFLSDKTLNYFLLYNIIMYYVINCNTYNLSFNGTCGMAHCNWTQFKGLISSVTSYIHSSLMMTSNYT